MFSAFFTGSQQDWKLMVVAPLLCALFRWIFIRVYGPKEDFASHKEKWLACFRYGFWWGMDYNAYVFLLSWICVSLPGAFFPAYGAVGDTVRAAAVTVYAVVLYLAFAGKMIFYYHFQDIYNPTMRLGKNADKKNLADIFFHQNHGGLILLGLIPYTALVAFGTKALLATPVLPCPTFNDSTLRYGFHAAFVIAMVLLFYFFRYGGHLSHRWKPEWDTVPDVVKEDMFFAKACVDDLIAIEMVFKAPVQTILGHKDAESEAILRPFFPVPDNGSLWESLKRTAAGPRIPRPKHIFLIVGESYTQAPFDDAFAQLHLVDRGKRFRANPHTIQIPNFLPAGLVSQPAITSLIAGIFDDNLEINEKRPFWDGQTLTSLPRQLKQLGYRTALWYGGSLSWASLGLFAKGMGFDETYGGPDICPPHAPSTWLGVYDHLFLAAAFQKMCDLDDDTPVFHLVYTTSNHGPYTIPIRQYGFDPAPVAQELPDDMKRRQNLLADLETYWYTDQALSAFAEQVQQRFPDSLILVTGDHSRKVIPFGSTLYPDRECSVREKYCTSFAMYHRDLSPDLFPQLRIGSHMNLLPTLIETIAPKGFPYYSLAPSLYEPLSHVVTPYHWLDDQSVGYYADKIAQPLCPRDAAIRREVEKFRAEKDAFCEVTGWIVRHADTHLKKAGNLL